MKKSKLLLLVLLVSSLVFPLLTGIIIAGEASVADQTPSETNSSVYIAVTEINPLDTTEISVQAVDTLDAVIEGANVTITAPCGFFTANDQSTIDGTTDSTGFFNVTWKAPQLSFLDLEQPVLFQAVISVNGTEVTVTESVTVKHLNDNAIKNSVIIAPSEVISGGEIKIATLAKDITDTITPNMQVTCDALEGSFQSPANGLTDSNGFFNVTWKAPILTELEPEKNVTIKATVEASGTISIELEKNVTVKLITATELTVTVDAPDEVVGGTEVTILLTVFAGSSPASGGSVTLSVDTGEFSNAEQMITSQINSTGEVEVTWTAPTAESNQTAGFGITAEYLTITDTDIQSFEILVYPKLGDFQVSWTHAATVNQNETLSVTLTVIDGTTSLPVQGAQVTLLLELGQWTESSDSSRVVTTDASGNVTAIFDGSNEELITVEVQVEISSTVEKDLYNTLESNTSFTLVKRPNTFDFNITVSDQEIARRETVNLTMVALKNGKPWVNATFELVTTAGAFPDGNATVKARTDAEGKLVITWDSSTLPELAEPLVIYISAKLVNSGLAEKNVMITVTPESSSADTAGTSGQQNGLGDLSNLLPVLLLVVAGVAGVAGGVVFLIRRR
ncbi:MAG: hypothetical protein ACFFD4_04425 [Candidatus Odinarchaeota archaeon]